jgi:hypothetical protein
MVNELQEKIKSYEIYNAILSFIIAHNTIMTLTQKYQDFISKPRLTSML